MDAIRIDRDSFSASLDPTTGALHRVSVDRTCLVYRVFGAFRDRSWGTPQPVVELIEHGADRTSVRQEYTRAGYGLTATTTFSLAPEPFPSLRIEYRAHVTADLERNRLGLCVLLPATLAGSRVTARHSAGGTTEGVLPVRIAPHQPFVDLAGLDIDTAGRRVALGFEGDTFEMEDQRNWTDFSYKIYSTPLSLPFPVHLRAGTVIEQAVTLEIGGSSRSSFAQADSPPTPGVTRRCDRLPLLGTRLVADEPAPPGVPLDFVRVDLPPARVVAPAGAATTPAAPVYLYRWGAPSAAEGPSAVAPPAGQVVAAIAYGDPATAALLAGAAGGVAHGRADAVALDAPLALIGTDGAFAELNRMRPRIPAGCAVAFTASPQVHDVDDQAVIDNLLGLRSVLESAVALYPDTPVVLGLVELTPHFNPAAGDYAENERLRAPDPRLWTRFALAWAFGAVCEAAAAGVHSICLFDASGPHGLVFADRVSPALRLFADLRVLAGSGGPYTLGLPAATIGEPLRYRLESCGVAIAAALDASGCTYETTGIENEELG